jgi:chitinase
VGFPIQIKDVARPSHVLSQIGKAEDYMCRINQKTHLKKESVLMNMKRILVIAIGFCLSHPQVSLFAQTKPWADIYWPAWEIGNGTNSYPSMSSIDFGAANWILFGNDFTTNGTFVPEGTPGATWLDSTAVRMIVSKAHAAGSKVWPCIGGANTDSWFEGATSSTTLQTFVNNIVALVKKYNYDGVDIDWEPINNSTQFYNFIVALRKALPSPYIISIAAPYTGAQSLMAQVAPYVDQINVMDYGLLQAWGGWVTWYASSVYPYGPGGKTITDVGGDKAVPSCDGGGTPPSDGGTHGLIAAGVPAAKIGIGAEFGGCVWQGGVMQDGNGVLRAGEQWTSAPSVQCDYPYNSIMQNYYKPQYYHWDSDAQAAYLSIDNPGTSNDFFITYDDTNSFNAKFNYIKQAGIGGIIFWDLGLASNYAKQLLANIKTNVNGGELPSTPDTVPPSVSISSPTNNSTLSGIVAVSAQASDNVSVASVTFQIDNIPVGTITASPYTISLNTANYSNGNHTITAIASDASGNTATNSITVNISNSGQVSSTNDLWIYNNGLTSGWSNGSAALVSGSSFSSGEIVYPGCTTAIKVVQSNSGALRFISGKRSSPKPIDPSPFTAVSFVIYSTYPVNLSVYLTSGGTNFPAVNYGPILNAQWTTVNIPFSSLDSSNQTFTGLVIKDISGDTVIYYVDNVRLVNLFAPTLQSPTNGSTSNSTSASLSWNAVAGANSYEVQVAMNQDFSTLVIDTTVDSSTLSKTIAVQLNQSATTYYWRVRANTTGTTSEWSSIWSFSSASVDAINKNAPFTLMLSQNYPNPFNPSTTIAFSIPKAAYVTLKIYNSLGQQVENLVEGNMSEGVHNISWDASKFPSGVYFYRLQVDGYGLVKKMMLIK